MTAHGDQCIKSTLLAVLDILVPVRVHGTAHTFMSYNRILFLTTDSRVAVGHGTYSTPRQRQPAGRHPQLSLTGRKF